MDRVGRAGGRLAEGPVSASGLIGSREDPDSRRLLVVDGQQRLKTLRQFFAGRFGHRDFALRGVGEDFAGKTIRSLELWERRELDQFIIHATIFEQDEPTDDRSSVYSVFERLNTGGTPLQAQEIRSSIYRRDVERTAAGPG